MGLFCEVNMRNDLLADIVTASGGTITDRNNRNLLLKDWLNAVQAPAVNYVARLNGTDQYWQLGGGIPLSNGDNFEFEAIVESTGLFSYVFDDDGGSFSRLFLIVNPDSTVTFRDYNMNLKVDGVSYVNGDTITFNDGLFHKFEIESLASVTLSKLGSRFNEVELISGVFKNLSVSKGGALTHEIPLTNKAQGATQLATVGNVNATMVGYNEDVWEQV